MLLCEFLDLPELEPVELAAREDAKGFDQHVRSAARLIFGRDLDSVVYTNLKKLIKNPVLRDRELNQRGLHVFRYVFATYAAKHRCRHPEWLVQGHVRVEAFLPDRFHRMIQDECQTWEQNPAGADCRHIANAQARTKHQAGLDYCMNRSGLRELVFECLGVDTTETRTLYDKNTYLQCLLNQPDDGDEQKDIHSDIFFPAIKWWYFPQRVELGQGPFRFQTSAPQQDQALLTWLHTQATSVCDGTWDRSRRRGHPEGSFRVTDQELQEMQITVDPITVEANTLILANVQLFHGRGSTIRPHVRHAVHGSIRIAQPFCI